DGDDAAVVVGGAALNIAHLVGETKTLALDDPLARSSHDSFSTASGPCGDCHGIVHSAVRRPARLCLPLLRPHCHLRLPPRSLGACAGCALSPSLGDRPPLLGLAYSTAPTRSVAFLWPSREIS